MEERKESTIKISLNINANVKGDSYFDEHDEEDAQVEIKPSSRDITHALGLIEDIRGGTFNYKDLQEVHFMNDVDLLRMVNGGKIIEDKTKSTQGSNNTGDGTSNGKKNSQIEDTVRGNINRELGDSNDNKSQRNGNLNEGNVYILESDVDKVCIIRFPPVIAKEIKKYFLKKNLDLEIEPTNLLNSRFFIIHFKNIKKKLYGILLELSTHIEIHKTLDRTNLYKASDVSQMMYVYEPGNKRNEGNSRSENCGGGGTNGETNQRCNQRERENERLIRKFIRNNFQLEGGINDKVKDFHFEHHAKLYKYHDVYFAEKLIDDYLNSNFYDYYDVHVKTFNEMSSHIQMEKENNTKHNEIVDDETDIAEILNSLDNTYNIMKKIEKENGNLNFESLLNYEIENENYESDVSDLLLGGSYYLQKNK
ncbi:transcription initiation factor TFIID subunit 7, putative [Plasmodium ovale]|uniref:Transcription initiation factor TFIID subunit 7, putative n=2 Tax=Plasmodium ovale TaxID=36330 RepID=A0A1C3KR23_PLAOA|nr:transcription initiation factor TFIID subunit 7, putative [Plasmodium ovale]